MLSSACLQQCWLYVLLFTCTHCSMLTPLLCPMQAVTDHFGKSDSEHKLSSKIVETYANSPIGQSAENGAIPLEYASVSADLEGLSSCLKRCQQMLAACAFDSSK